MGCNKFTTCPRWDLNPGSGERQQAGHGNVQDHLASRNASEQVTHVTLINNANIGLIMT